MPETNDRGDTALRYYQTIPHTIVVSGHQYAFVVRANICLAWIKAEHLEKVLSTTKICCGNSAKKVYHYANESDVRRWTNGGGR